MSERYTRLFLGEKNLYADNSPIIISAHTLLKDTETNRIVAQLKMRNISGQRISYVKIIITQLDTINNVLGKPEPFEYLDLSVGDMEEFGAKSPIILPNLSTRSFFVGVSVVRFANGSIWTCENEKWQPQADDSTIVRKMREYDVCKEAAELRKNGSKESLIKACALYKSISDFADVQEMIEFCEKRIKEIDQQKETKGKKKKKIIKLVSIILCSCILLVSVGYFAIYPLVSSLSGNYGVYVRMYEIKKFNIPEGQTKINGFSFQGCRSLESVNIPDSVRSIEVWAFSNCSFANITIPDSVTSIGGSAFRGCGLTSIVIPDSVISIGDRAFESCRDLASVTIGDSVTSIDVSTFEECRNLRSVVVGNSVASIGGHAFRNCTSLESIIIPDSVTSIGEMAFWCCKSLTSAKIGDGVTSIGDDAFGACTSLTSIIISDSVTSIGSGAFWKCSNLKTVYFTGTREEWEKIEIGNDNKPLINAKIVYNYIPEE